MKPGGRPSISPVGTALVSFQQWISLIYEAVKSGVPKANTRLEMVAREESTFDFAYSFPGSLGFVLTIPNERALVETNLDLTFNVALEMTEGVSAGDFRDLARRIGVGPIKAFYRWSQQHINAGFSAEIQWKRSGNVKMKRLIQMRELEQIQTILDSTSDVTEESITLRGELFGGDLHSKTFRLESSGDTIRGRLADDFRLEVPGIPEGELPLGRIYTATLKVLTTVKYSTEEEQPKYTLLKLSP